MARMTVRPTRRNATGARRVLLGVCATALVATLKSYSAFTGAFKAASTVQRPSAVARGAGVTEQVSNPVKTVSDTIADFYKAYPSPPVLPMYRTFIIDALTQAHLAVVDSRFKYDAVFALGVKTYYDGLMGAYDKLLGGSSESEKIWKAFCTSLGMDAAKVDADAEAATAYAKSAAPADILAAMEGSSAASEKSVADAFENIKSSLYSQSFSVGLFKMMELAGVELTKGNVEEWAKALKITSTKTSTDFETYKMNLNKLQKAEEMIREVEIREKKKLAQRLEEKAKALAAKAGGKAEEK